MDRFGSVTKLMHASYDQLLEVLPEDGAVCAGLVAARELMEIAVRERLIGSVVDPDDPRLFLYLRQVLGAGSTEKLYAIFLDEQDRYLSDECVADGEVARVTTSLRPLLRRAFELGARGLVLAHNHPSGSVRPSHSDVNATRKIRMLIQALDIRLVDHLIVSSTEVYSLRAAGLL
jgi:DNA repair protein RadC